jgi:hypothetical protein
VGGLKNGLVGALVLALRGRPFAKCCNTCPAPLDGNSDTLSRDSEIINCMFKSHTIFKIMTNLHNIKGSDDKKDHYF